MSDPRVPLIRARFGLGAAVDPSAAEVYDVRVVSAVAAFQRVHGLKASGALNVATSEALEGHEVVNTRREQLILANMEMWRWQPRDMGETRVEVNVPDFSLELKNGDSVVHRARVIVGKPDTPTPIFSNSISYMLFNPIWRVPESIIKKEMAPKLAQRSRLAGAPRLQGHLCRRPDRGRAAAGRSQCARPHAVPVSQRARGLSA